MNINTFIEELKNHHITTITGVPDSLLSVVSDTLIQNNDPKLHHYVAANEGAAVGIATGSYLASGHPAMVYMQNSGIGNTINPIASLLHQEVYGIPMLFLIGWRGEPGIKDEPQHKFQGRVTTALMDTMEIPYASLDHDTTIEELQMIFKQAEEQFAKGEQFAIIVHKNSFEQAQASAYQNQYSMAREDAISIILQNMKPNDMMVSTTGKISREVYEQSDMIYHTHERCFLTVGAMGHASMIAFGLSQSKKHDRVICMDGDGAALMHMGSLAFLGTQKPKHYLHIVLNNEAHESVGGMPTGAVGVSYAQIAKTCGYPHAIQVYTKEELLHALTNAFEQTELTMIEVMVMQGARSDLGRPKETPQENKEVFMKAWRKNL